MNTAAAIENRDINHDITIETDEIQTTEHYKSKSKNKSNTHKKENIFDLRSHIYDNIHNIFEEGRQEIEPKNKNMDKMREYLNTLETKLILEMRHKTECIFLNEYLSNKRVPRGLRIKKECSFKNIDSNFKKKWRDILEETSFKLMNLIKEYREDQLLQLGNEINEIETQIMDFKEITEYKKREEEIKQLLIKSKQELVDNTFKKFERDKIDYQAYEKEPNGDEYISHKWRGNKIEKSANTNNDIQEEKNEHHRPPVTDREQTNQYNPNLRPSWQKVEYKKGNNNQNKYEKRQHYQNYYTYNSDKQSYNTYNSNNWRNNWGISNRRTFEHPRTYEHQNYNYYEHHNSYNRPRNSEHLRSYEHQTNNYYEHKNTYNRPYNSYNSYNNHNRFSALDKYETENRFESKDQTKRDEDQIRNTTKNSSKKSQDFLELGPQQSSGRRKRRHSERGELEEVDQKELREQQHPQKTQFQELKRKK
ncbi:probable serine/threonine-protein kinase clkA [Bombina bombina]|uniref:probable serine/threonine-protein kinase clkA n=1 Tax=Bombina bombina TaxID=8345 RepID=UPI00235A83E2|nr:probable serine/threonine-protein kinase clkA [Bombina bombina]XP_053568661.1 probable serine/threonine-protein kinase clkA [Bombina bombina]